jgi:hypothetical protein
MKMPRCELASSQLPNHRSRCDVQIGGQLQNVLQKTKKFQTSNPKRYWEFSIHLGSAMIFFLSFSGIHINLCKSTYDTRHPRNRSSPSGKCRYFCFGLVAEAILRSNLLYSSPYVPFLFSKSFYVLCRHKMVLCLNF